MNRRLSSLFGYSPSTPTSSSHGFGRSRSTHGNQSSSNAMDSTWKHSDKDSDAGSVATDATERRKTTFGFKIDMIDDDIDYTMRNLYVDPEILEKNCQQSVSCSFIQEPYDAPYRMSKVADEEPDGSPARTVDDVRKDYFIPDFDPIKGYVDDVSTMDPDEYNSYFMEKILEVDEDKDIVLAKLGDMIEASYSDLVECMKNVNDIDLDLSRTLIRISEGRGSIKKGTDIMARESLQICQLHRKRTNISLLLDCIKSLKYVKDIFSAMQRNITTGDLGRAAEYLCIILKGTSHGEYRTFNALKNVESESKKVASIIYQKTDKALMRLCCRKFAKSEYENIVKAYLIMDDLHKSFGNSLNISTEGMVVSCMENLPLKVQNYHMDDIDNCLHTAIIEFIFAVQHKKQKTAQEVGALSPTNSADIMNLAEAPLYQLYQQVAPESVAQSIIRSCELFAASVHTYYQISNWHSQVTGDTLSDDTDLFYWQDEEIVILKAVNSHLMESRGALWNDILRGIIEMLSNVSITAAIPLEDYLAVIWAIQTTRRLGYEFCHLESNQLLACIDLKSKEYVQYVHAESFLIFQQLLDADPWENVPIRISEYGGITGILKSKLPTPRNENSLIRLILKYEESGLSAKHNHPQSEMTNYSLESDSKCDADGERLLKLFSDFGNPFHFMTEDDINAPSDNDTIDGQNRPSKSHLSDISSYLSGFLDDNGPDQAKLARGESKRSSIISDTFVVTQSVLNGLIKFTAKYMQMMYLIPHVPTVLWPKLCELYDYYLCIIFYSFLTTEEKNKFMAKPTKMGLPAMDQLKDFEVLHSYLEDAMSCDIEQPTSGGSDTTHSDSNTSNHSGSDIAMKSVNIEKRKFSSLLQIPSSLSQLSSDRFEDLNRKIVAAESCWFAARLLNEAKFRILASLPSNTDTSSHEYYISQYQLVASQLRSLIYKSICPQLVNQNWLLNQMEGGHWDSKKLSDSHHDWIDDIVTNCKEVWEHLNKSSSFIEFGLSVRQQLWLELCQAAFDGLLEGFAKIRKLTNEGRALMKMDVSALHDGLDTIETCRPPRGKHHLNNFISATYLSEEDTLTWLQGNWQSFTYRQLHGLLTLNLSSMLNSKKLKDALSLLDTLYMNESNSWQTTRYAELFEKGKDENRSISKMVSNRFRRASAVLDNR